MSVFKRGDFWWYDFTLRDGKRRRASTKQRSKAAALRVEARERERAELGEAPAQFIPTLKEAADRWFASKVEGRKSASTVALRLEIALRTFDPDALVTDIRTPDVEDAIQRRRLEVSRQGKVPSNATVNRDLVDTTLRPILGYCRAILEIPCPAIDWRRLRLPEPKGRTRDFTVAELHAWRTALPVHHRPVFDFIAAFGVRLSEAFFPPAAFDPETRIITLRQRKNGLPHVLTLTPEEARELAARRGRALEAGLPSLWFREGRRRLWPITPRGFQNASYKALRAAGVADARAVHDLRHHAATAFLRLPGATAFSVQQFLGHEDIKSTARYAHVSQTDVYNIRRRASATNARLDETEASENSKITDERTGT